MATLNIITETLHETSAECFSYLKTLLGSKPALDFSFELWVDRRGKALFQQQSVHPYFHQSLRQLQKWLLYFNLLHKQEAIFLPNAEYYDMLVLDCLLKLRKSDAKIFLHFHNIDQKILPKLRHLAARRQSWVITADNQQLLAIFMTAGFKYCQYVPTSALRSTGAPVPVESLAFNRAIYSTLCGMGEHPTAIELRRDVNFRTHAFSFVSENSVISLWISRDVVLLA